MSFVLFIRHGATKGNLEKRYIGRTDEPLCDAGISRALSLGKQNFRADCLFVSPLLRTKQTAKLIFPQTSFSVIDGFAETDFGIFEGKTAAELSDDPAYRAWVDTMCLSPIPGGESVSAFKNRCCKAFREVMQSVPENAHAVFVLHGGVIMAILEQYARPMRSFYDYYMENGAYKAYRYKDGYLTNKE